MILINFPFFFFFIDFSRQIEASLFAEYHYFHWFVLTFFFFFISVQSRINPWKFRINPWKFRINVVAVELCRVITKMHHLKLFLFVSYFAFISKSFFNYFVDLHTIFFLVIISHVKSDSKKKNTFEVAGFVIPGYQD